jgi:hypothetical protein
VESKLSFYLNFQHLLHCSFADLVERYKNRPEDLLNLQFFFTIPASEIISLASRETLQAVTLPPLVVKHSLEEQIRMALGAGKLTFRQPPQVSANELALLQIGAVQVMGQVESASPLGISATHSCGRTGSIVLVTALEQPQPGCGMSFYTEYCHTHTQVQSVRTYHPADPLPRMQPGTHPQEQDAHTHPNSGGGRRVDSCSESEEAISDHHSEEDCSPSNDDSDVCSPYLAVYTEEVFESVASGSDPIYLYGRTEEAMETQAAVHNLLDRSSCFGRNPLYHTPFG